MPTRYGLDPESLALAGPEALASMFRGSSQGLVLGDQLASSALKRELMRRQDARVSQDRLTAATLGDAVDPSPAAARAGGGGKGAPFQSAIGAPTLPSFAQYISQGQRAAEDSSIAPLGDSETIWGSSLAPTPRVARAVAFIKNNNSGADPMAMAREMIQRGDLSEGEAELLLRSVAPRVPLVAAAQAAEGAALPTGREIVPTRNPLTQIGYRDDEAPAPMDAAAAIRRRASEYGLDREGATQLVQDYENWHRRVRGDYEQTMADLIAADQARQAAALALEQEALEEQQAIVDRGAQIAIAQESRGYKPTEDDLPFLAAFLQANEKAYMVPSGQRTDVRQSNITAAAPLMKARLAQDVEDEERRLLGQMKEAEYDSVFEAAVADGESVEAAHDLATRASKKIGSVAGGASTFTEREKGESRATIEAQKSQARLDLADAKRAAESGAPLTSPQVVAGLKYLDGVRGITGRTDADYANQAEITLGSEGSLLAFRKKMARGERPPQVDPFKKRVADMLGDEPTPTAPAVVVRPLEPASADLVGKRFNTGNLTDMFKKAHQGRAPSPDELAELSANVTARGAIVSE